MRLASSLGVSPAAGTSPMRGNDSRPSAPTLAVRVRSSWPKTMTFRTSFGPMR